MRILTFELLNIGTLNPCHIGTLECWNIGALKHWNIETFEHLNIQHLIDTNQHQWTEWNSEKVAWIYDSTTSLEEFLSELTKNQFRDGCYHVFLNFSFWYRNIDVLNKSWGVAGRGLGWRQLGSIPSHPNTIPTQSQQEM